MGGLGYTGASQAMKDTAVHNWPEKSQAPSRPLRQTFRHAVHGMAVAFRQERNLRFQVLIGLAALAAAVGLQVSFLEAAMVVVMSAAVIGLELVNSSLEALADAVHPAYHPAIERAKDMAAGAVLLASMAAAAVGAFIFAPRLVWLVLGITPTLQ